MGCELSSIWPDDVYVFSGDSADIKPGDTSFTIDAFVNWKGRMFRGTARQFMPDPGDGNTFFTYDPDTGTFYFPEAQDQEEFVFEAYKPTV